MAASTKKPIVNGNLVLLSGSVIVGPEALVIVHPIETLKFEIHIKINKDKDEAYFENMPWEGRTARFALYNWHRGGRAIRDPWEVGWVGSSAVKRKLFIQVGILPFGDATAAVLTYNFFAQGPEDV